MARRIGSAVFALFVAITVGAIVATVANWIAWRTTVDALTVAEAKAAMSIGAPDLSTVGVSWVSGVDEVRASGDPGSIRTINDLRANFGGADLPRRTFDAMSDRYRAAGWRTEREDRYLLASRGGLVLEWFFTPVPDSPDLVGSVSLLASRNGAQLVRIPTFAGWGLGALIGAGLAWAVTRRDRVRVGLAFVLGIGILLLTFPTILAISLTISEVMTGSSMSYGRQIELWHAYLAFG